MTSYDQPPTPANLGPFHAEPHEGHEIPSSSENQLAFELSERLDPKLPETSEQGVSLVRLRYRAQDGSLLLLTGRNGRSASRDWRWAVGIVEQRYKVASSASVALPSRHLFEIGEPEPGSFQVHEVVYTDPGSQSYARQPSRPLGPDEVERLLTVVQGATPLFPDADPTTG